MVERLNGTIVQMLRKFVRDEPKKWDQYLPYLLFAYRETKQASTGFSPFELIYGHHVRGPLDVLREEWEEKKKGASESVVSYLVNMRERLSKWTETAHQNLLASQERQKTWYDHNRKPREFEAGEEVLVLLPCGNSKLEVQWQGPYKILKKSGSVDYLVEFPEGKKKSKLLHVNLLRKYHRANPNEILFIQADNYADTSLEEMTDYKGTGND